MSTGISTGSREFSGKGTIGEYGITIIKSQDAPAKCSSSCFSTSADQSILGTQHVPFKNVLFCENLSPGEVELTYAVESGNSVSIQRDALDIGAYRSESQVDLASHILSLSYNQSTPKPRILVLLNNHGGQGHARKLYHKQILPVLRAARAEYTYVETMYSTHATEIARELDIADFDIVACCSGDGVPHEVINGFYQRPDRESAFDQVAITQLPCGSGNAFSLSSHGTSDAGIATVRMLKSSRTRMDVMAVRQGNSTKLSFLSQAYGTIADSDIGTEHLRWLGPMRFELGVTHKLLTKATYPCDLYVKYAMKDPAEIQSHYDKHRVFLSDDRSACEEDLQLSSPPLDKSPPSDWEKLPGELTDDLNIFYVGKMPYMSGDTQFFPAALPDDGCMDMVITTAKTPFFKMAKLLFSVDHGGHVHSPEVLHSKIAAYRLVPRISSENHFISVDGENFPFEPLQVEVLRKVMTVLLDHGSFVDTSFTNRESV
ncbi:hypothetical protein JCM33374_g673 [Metschnikowia sp. JCM 33374]|nr:hypothetical protein JCM33374_g673 [Metschnikowia sp. JCM 33374]